MSARSRPSPNEWENSGRFPIHKLEDLMRQAATSERLYGLDVERNAIILDSQCEQLPQFAGIKLKNFHMLIAGQPKMLAAKYVRTAFFRKVASVYDFSYEHDWRRQWRAFEDLWTRFFETDSISGPIAWASLITIQRPSPLRSLEDSRLQIASGRPILDTAPQRLRGNCQPPESPLICSMAKVKDTNFLFSTAGDRSRYSLRKSLIPRQLVAQGWLPSQVRYNEWRYTPAVLGEHDDLLLSGKMPSLIADYGYKERYVGATGFLNMCRISETRDGRLELVDNTLEINPASGRIVTLRGYTLPFSAGILAASVVEHVALSEAMCAIAGHN